tara:strand:- start:6081 stop:6557 length:477 start_codon:yes stop_codon:yes gene_type:complete
MSLYQAVNSAGDTIFEIGSDGGISTQTMIVKGRDESIAEETRVQNDDELFFSVGASEYWTGEVCAFVSCGSATPGFSFDFRGPIGTTFFYGDSFSGTAVSSGAVGFTQSSGDHLYVLKFSISVGVAAGTINFRWAQNASSRDTTTVKEKSYLKAIKEC